MQSLKESQQAETRVPSVAGRWHYHTSVRVWIRLTLQNTFPVESLKFHFIIVSGLTSCFELNSHCFLFVLFKISVLSLFLDDQVPFGAVLLIINL